MTLLEVKTEYKAMTVAEAATFSKYGPNLSKIGFHTFKPGEGKEVSDEALYNATVGLSNSDKDDLLADLNSTVPTTDYSLSGGWPCGTK